MLAEGDPETLHGSFSGITHSLLLGLRAAGHHVISSDVDLRGFNRYVGAALTFSPNRQRWGVKYRLFPAASRLRSAKADRIIAERIQGLNLILQIGATFRTVAHPNIPYVLYCDSNIRNAESGAWTGESDASSLTKREIETIAGREATVYTDAKVVFTLSEHLRSTFVRHFNLAPEKVQAIYAGPNLDPALIPARRIRAPQPTILFVGVQFSRKGGDVLLRAFRMVRAAIPDARLVIIGPSVSPSTDEGVVSMGFLRKDVPGELEQMIGAYSQADVFCLPTRYEPFGVAFIEAMHFGLPCVGTNSWAVPEMITDGVTGYTVPIDDPVALSQRLIELLRNRDLALNMGGAGRTRAERDFTWSAVVRRMLASIERAITEPVPPQSSAALANRP